MSAKLRQLCQTIANNSWSELSNPQRVIFLRFRFTRPISAILEIDHRIGKFLLVFFSLSLSLHPKFSVLFNIRFESRDAYPGITASNRAQSSIFGRATNARGKKNGATGLKQKSKSVNLASGSRKH